VGSGIKKIRLKMPFNRLLVFVVIFFIRIVVGGLLRRDIGRIDQKKDQLTEKTTLSIEG
jgi:hypothetical protein